MKQLGTFRILAALAAAVFSVGAQGQVRATPKVFVGGYVVPGGLAAEFDKWHQFGVLPRAFNQRFIVEEVEGAEFVRLREDPLLSQLERRSAFFSEIAKVASSNQGALLTPETTSASFQAELDNLRFFGGPASPKRIPVVATAGLAVTLSLDLDRFNRFPFHFTTKHPPRAPRTWPSSLIKAIQEVPRPPTELNQIEGFLNRTTAIVNFGGAPGSRSELVSRVLWRYEQLVEAAREAMLESELQTIRSLESTVGLPGLSEVAAKRRVKWSALPEGVRTRLAAKLESLPADPKAYVRNALSQDPNVEIMVDLTLEAGFTQTGIIRTFVNAVQFPIGRL